MNSVIVYNVSPNQGPSVEHLLELIKYGSMAQIPAFVAKGLGYIVPDGIYLNKPKSAKQRKGMRKTIDCHPISLVISQV